MENEIEKEWKEKLEDMGFAEKEDKPGLWFKNVEGGFAHWDFRKAKKGKFYVSIDGGGIKGGEEAKTYPEYIAFRNIQKDENTEETISQKPTIVHKPKIVDRREELQIRGNETSIENIVKSMRMEMIIRASKDPKKPGEGVLYHDLGSIGLEPSAELVDMITVDMGDIETEVLEQGTRTHLNINTGEEYQTQYAIVRATDIAKGTTGIGSAEELIDFDEMKKNHRSFALTKAVRKAERNAKERLIPVPRRAMVELVKELIIQYQKAKNGFK